LPHENGIHYIHVKFNGIHIPGSPFKLKVGEEDCDPAAIKVKGDGISKAVSGKKLLIFDPHYAVKICV
jgi:filamin